MFGDKLDSILFLYRTQSKFAYITIGKKYTLTLY